MTPLTVGQAVLWSPKTPSSTGPERLALARFGPLGWHIASIAYGGVLLSHPKQTHTDRGLWVDPHQVRSI
jgi:hypothetical protein